MTALQAAMKRLSPASPPRWSPQLLTKLRRRGPPNLQWSARPSWRSPAASRASPIAALAKFPRAHAIEGGHGSIWLKSKPQLIVSVPPDALPHVRQKLEALQRGGQLRDVQVIGDASARPGDWRVEWGEGATGFKADDIEAAVRAAISARLADPVDVQADLFSAA